MDLHGPFPGPPGSSPGAQLANQARWEAQPPPLQLESISFHDFLLDFGFINSRNVFQVPVGVC